MNVLPTSHHCLKTGPSRQTLVVHTDHQGRIVGEVPEDAPLLKGRGCLKQGQSIQKLLCPQTVAHMIQEASVHGASEQQVCDKYANGPASCSLEITAVKQFPRGTQLPGFTFIIRDRLPPQVLVTQIGQELRSKCERIQEISHRVKNNLCAILGLLYAEKRQLERESPADQPPRLDRLINQVSGIAAAHELLSQTEWEPIQIDALCRLVLRSCLRGTKDESQIEVKVAACDIQLEAREASSLGLVLGELTTNTLKHGLRSSGKNRIVIRCQARHGNLELEYRDTGPGYPPATPNGTHRGLQLIENLVKLDLQGTCTHHTQRGAVTRITMPMPKDHWASRSSAC
jgi:two-component sensor histidine kinase